MCGWRCARRPLEGRAAEGSRAAKNTDPKSQGRSARVVWVQFTLRSAYHPRLCPRRAVGSRGTPRDPPFAAARTRAAQRSSPAGQVRAMPREWVDSRANLEACFNRSLAPFLSRSCYAMGRGLGEGEACGVWHLESRVPWLGGWVAGWAAAAGHASESDAASAAKHRVPSPKTTFLSIPHPHRSKLLL